MKASGFARITHSNARTYSALQSAWQNCLVKGHNSIWSCEFYTVKCNVSIYEIKFWKLFQFLPNNHCGGSERTKRKTDLKNNIIRSTIVFEGSNRRKNRGLVWDKLVRDLSFSLSFSQLFVILLISFGCLLRIDLAKTCDEPIVEIEGLEYCSRINFSSPWKRASHFLQKFPSFYLWSTFWDG